MRAPCGLSGIKLTERINNKLEKRNLINEHALSREPVPLKIITCLGMLLLYIYATQTLCHIVQVEHSLHKIKFKLTAKMSVLS